MFVDPPWGKKLESWRAKTEDHPDLPLPREEVDKNRQNRSPYFMIREATQIEMKELKEAQFELGNELREKCRPEIDSYVECCTDRVFSIFKACKQPAIDMRKCLKKVETKEYVDRRTREILEERLRNGRSLVRATDRSMYNDCFLPTDDTTPTFDADGNISRRRPGLAPDHVKPKKVNPEYVDKMGNALDLNS